MSSRKSSIASVRASQRVKTTLQDKELRKQALSKQMQDQKALQTVWENVQRMRRLQEQANARELGRMKRLEEMEKEGRQILDQKQAKFDKYKAEVASRVQFIKNEIDELERSAQAQQDEEQRLSSTRDEVHARNEIQLQPARLEVEQFASIVQESKSATQQRDLVLQRERKEIEVRIAAIAKHVAAEKEETQQMRVRQDQFFATRDVIIQDRLRKMETLRAELSLFQKKIADKEAELQVTKQFLAEVGSVQASPRGVSPGKGSARSDVFSQRVEFARRTFGEAKQRLDSLTHSVDALQSQADRLSAQASEASRRTPIPYGSEEAGSIRKRTGELSALIAQLQNELDERLAENSRIVADVSMLRTKEQERVQQEDIRAAKANMFISMKTKELERSAQKLKALRGAEPEARATIEAMLADRQYRLVEQEEANLIQLWDTQRQSARAELDELQKRLDEQDNIASKLQAVVDVSLIQRGGTQVPLEHLGTVEDRQALRQQQQLIESKETERARLLAEKQSRSAHISTLRKALQFERDASLLNEIGILEGLLQAEVVDNMARVDRELGVARQRLEELSARISSEPDMEATMEDKRQRLYTARQLAARLKQMISEKRTAMKETLLDREAKVQAIESWKRSHDPSVFAVPRLPDSLGSPERLPGSPGGDSDGLATSHSMEEQQLKMVQQMQIAKAEAHSRAILEWRDREAVESKRSLEFHDYEMRTRARIKQLEQELEAARCSTPLADLEFLEPQGEPLMTRAPDVESEFKNFLETQFVGTFRALNSRYGAETAMAMAREHFNAKQAVSPRPLPKVSTPRAEDLPRAATEAVGQLASHKSELESARTAFNAAKAALEEAETELARTVKQRGFLAASDPAGVQRLADAHQREINALRASAEQLERDIRRLQGENDADLQHREQQKRELETLIAERLARVHNDVTQRQLAELEDKLQLNEVQRQSLRDNLKSKQDMEKELQTQLQELQAKCNASILELDDQIQVLRHNAAELRKQARQKRRDLELIDAELARAQQAHDQMIHGITTDLQQRQRTMMLKAERANSELLTEVERLRPGTQILVEESPTTRKVVAAIEDELKKLDTLAMPRSNVGSRLDFTAASVDSSRPPLPSARSNMSLASATSAGPQVPSAALMNLASRAPPSVGGTRGHAPLPGVSANAHAIAASLRKSPSPTRRPLSPLRSGAAYAGPSSTSAAPATVITQTNAAAIAKRPISSKSNGSYAATNGGYSRSFSEALQSSHAYEAPAGFGDMSPITRNAVTSRDESMSPPAGGQESPRRRDVSVTVESRCPFSISELDEMAMRLRPLLQGIPVYKKNPSGKRIPLGGSDLAIIERTLIVSQDLSRLEVRIGDRKIAENFVKLERIQEFRPRKITSDIKPRNDGNVVAILVKDEKPMDLLIMDPVDHEHVVDGVALLMSLKQNLYHVRWHVRHLTEAGET
eukprot:TRINITY_DN10454_c0_g1_i1.p1 TRINITY_DN10454_c0_g1~~TRINITY_DN10454_c0_g1_i1.p1  ORF type:complete len:1450 (-),score=362.69 TRINITY_DN10454_c0_g1_i1:1812-6161(-)